MWSEAYKIGNDETVQILAWPDANEHPLYYVGIYAVIGLSIVLSSSLSSMTQYTGALKASRTLFK